MGASRKLIIAYVMVLGIAAAFTAPLPAAVLGFCVFIAGLVILIPRRQR